MSRIVTLLNIHPVWWGGWPWQWRLRYVKQSRWGPFGELVLGFVGFTWPTDSLGPSNPNVREGSNQDRDPASRPAT